MTAEELEAAMAGLVKIEVQPLPEGPKRAGELLPMVRPIERNHEAIEAERAKRKAAMQDQRRREIAEERERIAPRIHERLLTAITKTKTPCALLLGPTGTGKTSAMHWLRAGLWGEIIHSRVLGSCERRHGLGEGYPPELETVRRARVLYLDDIGTEEPRDLGVIQYAIEHRYAHGLATVASTGLSKDELTRYLGAAYVRRLVQQHVHRRDGEEWPVLVCDLFGGAT